MIRIVTRCKDCIHSYIDQSGNRKCVLYGIMFCMGDEGFCDMGLMHGNDVTNLHRIDAIENGISYIASVETSNEVSV